MKKLLSAALAALVLTACQEGPKAEPKMLGITGYNYTDRYIDGFSVNGQGGTNMGAHTNGSGEACCIVWRPGTALPVVMRVEWTYGIEGDLQTGEVFRQREDHSAEVELQGPIPAHPTVLVVHFYPNNTVQVEVAEDYPEPRIKRSDLNKGSKP